MISSLREWWAQPFDSNGGVVNWALFIGLILVLIFLWTRVIGMFESVGEAVAEAAAG
jgi:hypothetical protein